MPAVSMKIGAQKCVIHRVKKSGTIVFGMSVGSTW